MKLNRGEVLSFIIPTYNEEKNIVKTIAKINEYVPSIYQYEIIVVDNGSTDNTVLCAKKTGVNVYVESDITIAGLRNFGAQKAVGDIFVFLDADISLTLEWQWAIGHVLGVLRGRGRLLTGSWYCIPENPNWIEQCWFKPLQRINNTHINSGHLILAREQFNELLGFNGSLETGEDYDISMRAKALGIQVVDDHDLKVIHRGYPKGLWEFILREYWHGKGDSISLKVIVDSKVALLSIMFLFFHVILLFSIFISLPFSFVPLSLVGIILLCIGSSYVKFKQESIYMLLINALIYYFYFLARGGSLLGAMFQKKIKKRQR